MKAVARLLLACAALASATVFAAPSPSPALQEGVHYAMACNGSGVALYALRKR